VGYGAQGVISDAGNAAVAADLAPLLTAMVANNDSRIEDGKVIGDPLEAALLVLAAKGGVLHEDVLRSLPRVAELPFDSAHKFMATFHRDGEQVQVFVKGAPDVLLTRCTTWHSAASAQPMDATRRRQIDADYQALGEKGLRGLLIASRNLAASPFDAGADLSSRIKDL
jgi:P-type Ca2+ transporter type 2C